MHLHAVARADKTSKWVGSWKLDDPEYISTFLKFTLLYSFFMLHSQEGEIDKIRGIWMFDPNDQAIIFVGFPHLLCVKLPVTRLGMNKFILKLPDQTLRGRRLKDEATKIERLTFKEDDFLEDPENRPTPFCGWILIPWCGF